jgi:CHAT domain-containing protein
LALEEHQLDKAESYWKEEVKGGSLDRQHDVDALLDEGEIAVAHKNFATATRIFPQIIQDPGPFVIRRAVAQSLMGQSYWMEGKVVLADQMFRDGMKTIESLLSTMKEESRGSFLDQNLIFDIYINFLVAQNKPNQALQIAEYVRELTQNIHSSKAKELDVALIQHGLNQNQVVLDYQLTEDESYLWVLTRKNFQMFHLPSHQELNPLIASYNSSIQDQRPIDDRLSGQELYKALVQPAEKLIPKGAHVTIVPSKILCLMNFETLVVPGSIPHYWIEDVVVQNSSSLALPKTAEYAHGRNAKDLLLIGAPEEVSASFPILKHASDEIARVKDRFQAAKEQIISGVSATPQSYKSSNPQEYRFIHFVTHGIANDNAPMESAIVLSGTAGSYKLYARDIITTPIKADLVTISACYGAGKRWYVSEGMVGLGWAFMRAGAHQVVAALWEVDDTSTPQLMDDFYGGLTSGQNAADALRAAKIKMLHAGGPGANPYYWASLQLYGGS